MAAKLSSSHFFKTRAELVSATYNKIMKAKKENKQTTLKIRFLLMPAGRFLLTHNIGDVVEMEAKQANELIEAAYAELA